MLKTAPLNPQAVRHALTVRSSTQSARQLAGEVQDLTRIHSLSLRLATNQSLGQALQDVLQTAGALVGAPLGSVQVLSSAGALDMVGQIGFGENIVAEFPTVSLQDCTTCSRALKTGARVIVRDLAADPEFVTIAQALRSYGATGAVSTPVLDSGNNVLAMISVYWREPHDPSDRELRALDLCAELAGRHVERSAAAKVLRDRESLLMRELTHRGKNLLAVVQAIASRTFAGQRSLDEERDAFLGRVQALARTYDTLTDEASEKAQLHDIVSLGLRALSDRADVQGPTVVIPAKNAQTLSLMVHELATNAAKHGALSVPRGRVEVKWKLTPDEKFAFEWVEHGGPPVATPVRKGFGSVIITSIVGSALNCEPSLEYSAGGFRYGFECSLDALVEKSG